MKNLIYVSLACFIMACGGESKPVADNHSETQKKEIVDASKDQDLSQATLEKVVKVEEEMNMVTSFLQDHTSLESVQGNAIEQFVAIAKKQAVLSKELNKENVQELLETAKSYTNCVITTGNHTIAVIEDLEKCKPSGAWATCMPYAKGYVKKGNLSFKQDYVNNIIGIPDNQTRMMFLF